jgi:hypothetical protein
LLLGEHSDIRRDAHLTPQNKKPIVDGNKKKDSSAYLGMVALKQIHKILKIC